jgi:branched-chain amino acid transport system ATP-binding protein
MIVEHDMQVVMETADTISVLANGSVLAEGSPADIRGNALVQEAYLGNAFAH